MSNPWYSCMARSLCSCDGASLPSSAHAACRKALPFTRQPLPSRPVPFGLHAVLERAHAAAHALRSGWGSSGYNPQPSYQQRMCGGRCWAPGSTMGNLLCSTPGRALRRSMPRLLSTATGAQPQPLLARTLCSAIVEFSGRGTIVGGHSIARAPKVLDIWCTVSDRYTLTAWPCQKNTIKDTKLLWASSVL